MQKKTRIALLAAAALLLPAATQAQEAQSASAEVSAQEEAAQLLQRIAALQQRAQQDPAIRVQQAAFAAFMLQAMERLDPAVREKSDRADAIGAEVEAARAANDQAKLEALAAEAQQLQAYFADLQQRVRQQPEVQEKRQEFINVLFAKMSELDPQAPAMVQRLRQLRASGAASSSSTAQAGSGGAQQR